MRLMEMLQEGGWLAWVALLLGALGSFFGLGAVALALGKSRAASGLGITTLLFSTLAAGAGLAGTFWGRQQVERALAMVDSSVDVDRILRAGFREAAQASIIGAFAALLPLLLGSVGALVGARSAAPPQRRQGLEGAVPMDEGGGRSVVAMVFIVIGALATAGAWVTGHRPPPPSKYDIADDDHTAWALANAIERVEKGRPNDCNELEEALGPYWGSDDRREWPRTMRKIPASLSGWRKAADGCATKMLDANQPALLLGSVLLQDEALRAKALASVEPLPSTAARNDETGGPSREEVRRIVMTASPLVRRCYELALKHHPSLSGKLTVSLDVRADGTVASAVEHEESKFADAKVVDCVTRELSTLRFPRRDADWSLVYPFVLNTAAP